MKRIAGLAVGAVLCIMLAGCSSTPVAAGVSSADAGADTDQTSTAGGSQVVTCTLLPAAAVTTIMGYKIASADGAGGSCSYSPADTTQHLAFQVFLSADGDTEWASQQVTMKSDDGALKPFSGVGDRAVGGFKEFAAQHGSYVVSIIDADYDANGPNAKFPKSQELAKALFVATK